MLEERDALRRLAEICVGLQRLHSLDPSLAHRDIKPGTAVAVLGRLHVQVD